MGDIPRELFVPSTHVGIAYADDSIRLISDRYLMQPLVLARLLQAAEIKDKDRVLELAPATGYSTLVLTALTSSVICVEPDALLHKEVEKNIESYACGRAVALAGAPIEGCIVHAPFDVIFFNGCVEFIPYFLFDQMDENGRLVAVVRSHSDGRAAHVGQARLYRKTNGEVSWTALFETNTPLVPGFAKTEEFEF
ncbi:MAG: rRNA adenine N-6-methyltransferase family protein [Bdellovibrionales bacterium]